MGNLIFLVISLIAFRAILDLSYIDFVQPLFEYMGFGYNYNSSRYIISWVVYLASFLILTVKIKKVSDYFLLTCTIFLIAPVTSLYGLDYILSSKTVIFCLISIVIIKGFLIREVNVLPNIGIIRGSYKFSLYLSFSMILVVAIHLYLSGISLNFNPEAVYEFRDQNAELAEGGIWGYLNNWVYQIITMYLLVVFLNNKNIIGIVLILIIQVFFFAASSHKSVLFMPLMVFGLWMILTRTNKSYYIVCLYLFLVTSLYGVFLIFDDILLPSIFIRRAFFVPAQLNFVYVDFFSNNEFVYWSQSILKDFINYPYAVDVSSLIGSWVMGDDTRANNGLIASGFANAGIIGVILYSIILGLLLRLIDDLSLNRLPVWFPVSMTAIPLNVAMIQADLPTSILTHGLLLSILLIFMSVSKSKVRSQESNET